MPAITPFNQDWCGHHVNDENISDYTGLTKDQFIELSGCYGFQKELEDEHCKISGEYQASI
jgi:hypothetical protein